MNEGNARIHARLREIALNAMRIVFGLMFMQHGAQKLFAVLGRDTAAQFPEQFWFAGVLEFWGGMLIVLGAFTRPLAFVLAGEMAVAYFQSHFPRSWFPIVNGGEPTVLFCFAFLFLAANGGGSFSVDGLLARRRKEALP
jgi:putative oxidoreductase